MSRVRFFFPHPGQGAGAFTVRLYRLNPTLLVELVTTYEVSSTDFHLLALQALRREGTEVCREHKPHSFHS